MIHFSWQTHNFPFGTHTKVDRTKEQYYLQTGDFNIQNMSGFQWEKGEIKIWLEYCEQKFCKSGL